ncbi:MAG: hypothetical protein ACQESG_01600 [Nanobdellota archaeon]
MKGYVLIGIVVMLMGCTPSTPEEICQAEGGDWREFPNGCVDTCESQRENVACAQVMTEGCDCGPGMCWNGATCVPI